MLKGPKTIDSHYSYSALITDNDQFISVSHGFSPADKLREG